MWNQELSSGHWIKTPFNKIFANGNLSPLFLKKLSNFLTIMFSVLHICYASLETNKKVFLLINGELPFIEIELRHPLMFLSVWLPSQEMKFCFQLSNFL